MKSGIKKISVFVGALILVSAYQNCSKMGTNGIAVEDGLLALEGEMLLPETPAAVAAVNAEAQAEAEAEAEAEAAVAPGVTIIPPSSSIETAVQPVQQPATQVAEQPASSQESQPVAEQPASSSSSEQPVAQQPTVSQPTQSTIEQVQQVVEQPVAQPVAQPSSQESQQVAEQPASSAEQSSQAPSLTEPLSPITSAPASSVVEITEVADALRICKQSSLDRAVAGSEIRVNHSKLDVQTENVLSLRSVQSSVVLRAGKSSAVVGDAKITHGSVVLCNYSEIASIRGVQTNIIVVGGEVKDAHLTQSTLILVNAKLGNFKGSKTLIQKYSVK